MNYCLSLLCFTAVLLPSSAIAQGGRADYERAAQLRDRSSGKVFRSRVDAHWLDKEQGLWYRNNLANDSHEFVLVDTKDGKRSFAFDHERLAKGLAKTTQKTVDPAKLPFETIYFDNLRTVVRFRAYTNDWECSLASYEVVPSTVVLSHIHLDQKHDDPAKNRSQESPDGRWVSFIRDHNVFVRDRGSDVETQLTDDGSADEYYESRHYWSPDSHRLVGVKTKRGANRHIHLIEAAPDDQIQPKLHAMKYLKPGDDIPLSKPVLFDVIAARQITISDDLFENPWKTSHVIWNNDSRRFTFLYNERGHKTLRVIAVDATTGECGALIEEHSDTFIDYAYKTFLERIEASNEIIWMSERDGWNHLFLHDSQTGQLKNQITRGEWMVQSVEHVDRVKRRLWFMASGVYPEQDPYYLHYCRVNFNGSGFKILTRGNGTHSIRQSPNRKFFVDTHSRVDMPPVTELRRTENGRLLCEIERADWTALLATGWQVPERFVAKGRDDETDIYGVIWRPTNFDPAKTNPVIENIYAGPHGAFVPKRFSSHYRAQELAELGFIVVKTDGMGTNWRGKKFHDVCWKNLGDSGFPDRIAWIKAAAKQYPYIDLTRVGIYGGSAGGQSSTRAVLAHGDFYKVAVSDCGCHDNRMDKIWWNELWMGWPLGSHYEEQSNVTNAHRLVGKLFLIVGAMDRNVDPSSTMQVVNALIKADKDFDLLVVPDGGHGIAESKYGTRRRRDFFVRHLLGVEPRSETPH